MSRRINAVSASATLLIGLIGWACAQNINEPDAAREQAALGRGGFEVWLADQSDTRPGHGGQLLIFEGADLMGSAAAQASPIQRIDLGAATSDLCRAATGRAPVRPHMLLFNKEFTHAVLSFVASGHVVIFDAETRLPLQCFETSIGSTGTRQAHAAFPAPDGSYILVANQNGKQLERINTNFATNQFSYDANATLDLMTCTIPDGSPCESAATRPLNWPICPIIDASSRYAFVTLRGGGMFVIDAKAPRLTIVAAYDSATIRGNGCGGAQVGDHMFVNSGGSPVDVSTANPHHPMLHGFDVYRFDVRAFTNGNPLAPPQPEKLFSKGGAADSHGLVAAGDQRYLWVMDRHGDVAEILDAASGRHLNTVPLNGVWTDNAAPDLIDAAPWGNRLFVALRGPRPLSGDPHNATGSTPGIGIIQLTQNGRAGSLIGVVPLTNDMQQAPQQPDAHGIRVRLRR